MSPQKTPLILVLILALAVGLAGCAKKTKRSSLGVKAVLTAQKYLGVPYVYGGRSPKGFDCSGLVWYVYKENGLKLPNSSSKQVKSGRAVKKSELAPGDLVFFQSGGRVNHVGIYAGQGRMIHAPGRGRKVTTVKLSDKYYKAHYVTARRVF
ncbi:MAG: C40 family peptidase [Deltaproteobacteria bacterium]|jgi:cell wall-associated NlpC family hydrolase|nr:C40 family peptidase [Deltaproteobacteria bacterium]